jgi:hypothetical protein
VRPANQLLLLFSFACYGDQLISLLSCPDSSAIIPFLSKALSSSLLPFVPSKWLKLNILRFRVLKRANAINLQCKYFHIINILNLSQALCNFSKIFINLN